MKFLLVSDIHLGVKNNNEDFLYQTRDFFKNQVVKIIQEKDIDIVWILGDLFDSRTLVSVLVKSIAIDIMQALLDSKPTLEIKILAGNHDIYFKTTTEVASINVFKKFDDRVETITQIKGYNFKGYKVLAVPWLVEESRSWKSFNKIVNDFETTGKKTANLCLGHFEINGFEIVNGVVEEKGLDQTAFNSFDQTFSGHFHLRRAFDKIQYLGCPYEITWNDWGDDKGVTIWDTETNSMEFIQSENCSKHVLLKWSAVNKDMSLLQKAKDNYVKLVFDETPDATQRIEALDVIDTIGTRRLEILDETVESLDTSDLEAATTDHNFDPQMFINSFLDQINIPDGLDKTELIKYANQIYLRSLKN